MATTKIYNGGQISPGDHVQQLAVVTGESGNTYGTGITVTFPSLKAIVGAVVSNTLNTAGLAYHASISAISGGVVTVKLYGSNNAGDNAALTECLAGVSIESTVLYVIAYGK